MPTLNFHMQTSIEERHSTVMLLYQVVYQKYQPISWVNNGVTFQWLIEVSLKTFKKVNLLPLANTA